MKLSAKELDSLKAALNEKAKGALAAGFGPVKDVIEGIGAELTWDDAKLLREKLEAALKQFEPEKPKQVEGELKAEFTLDDMIELRADNLIKTRDLEASSLKVSELTAKLTEVTSELDKFKSEQPAIDAGKAELTEAVDFLKQTAQVMLVASGVQNPQIASSVKDLVASIRTASEKLSKLPVGGVALSANSAQNNGEVSNTTNSSRLAVFQPRKD